MDPRIVVVGSSNTDMVVKVSRLPERGETVLGGAVQMTAGGKGANQAVAAARAGGSVTFIGRVGTDLFGMQAIERFRAEGLHLDYLARDDSRPSGVALILVDEHGDNVIAVAPGCNAALAPTDVEAAAPALACARVLLLQLETPLETARTAAEIASARQVRVILDPSPARALDTRLLRLVSILTPNETEAEFLTGVRIGDPKSAGIASDRLLEMGPQVVMITLGAQGTFLASATHRELVPAFPVKAVDATAAGDVFNGALAVALAEGTDLHEAVRFASAAAAISVTRLGAQVSAPRRQQIEEFLEAHGRPAWSPALEGG